MFGTAGARRNDAIAPKCSCSHVLVRVPHRMSIANLHLVRSAMRRVVVRLRQRALFDRISLRGFA